MSRSPPLISKRMLKPGMVLPSATLSDPVSLQRARRISEPTSGIKVWYLYGTEPCISTSGGQKMSMSVGLELRIAALCEEYRALYSLLVFRLTAMEHRLPLIAAVLSVFVGGSPAMPAIVRPLVFWALPIAIGWFVHTTTGHARSKEDVKERLASIEREICDLIGAEVMVFQSRHPSRGRVVGGRSGRDLVVFVVGVALTLLASALVLSRHAGFDPLAAHCYAAFVMAASGACLLDAWLLRRYQPGPSLAATTAG